MAEMNAIERANGEKERAGTEFEISDLNEERLCNDE